MARMSTLIKKHAMNAVGASHPSGITIGTVIDTSPLRIRLRQNSKMVIDSDLVLLPERLTGDNSLNYGDRVIMISNNGGQDFAIIDRLA